MSRTSRVPYHQNVYDLLLIEPRHSSQAPQLISDWEQRTGHRFPPAMTEFYSTEALIPCGRNGSDVWSLSLAEVWHQYSNMEPPVALARSLAHSDEPPRARGPVPVGPYFLLQVENQGCWFIYARLTGADDPPTYATDGGPFFLVPQAAADADEWCELGSFTEMLFSWFAFYCYSLEDEIDESFVPLCYMSHRADPSVSALAPPKPYLNRLWLRSPAEPLAVPVLDFLTEQFGEPERVPRDGDVMTHTWRPDGGTIRVTADHPAHPEPLSAWWVHAASPDQLAALARLLVPWGTLAQTLRADTNQAREVWDRVQKT